MNERVLQGILYFVNSFGWDPITLTMIFSALGLAFISKRREDILMAFGIVLYLAYIIYIGGDFMSGRFFSAPLILSVVLLVRRAEDTSTLEKYTWIGLILLLGLLIAPLKSFTNPLESDLVTFDNSTGIGDERLGYYRFSNLLLYSRREHFTLYPFAETGLQLRREKKKVALVPAIGMVGYYAGPDVHVIDEFGLGDPLLARLKPVDIKDWRIAHFKRNLPLGYDKSVRGGENQIADPNLAAYYDKLRLIISGNLWTIERWEAILKMNTGQYDYLLEAYMKSQK